MRFEIDVDIEARPETVWRVLLDVESAGIKRRAEVCDDDSLRASVPGT